jgi:hypothetical protein
MTAVRLALLGGQERGADLGGKNSPGEGRERGEAPFWGGGCIEERVSDSNVDQAQMWM